MTALSTQQIRDQLEAAISEPQIKKRLDLLAPPSVTAEPDLPAPRTLESILEKRVSGSSSTLSSETGMGWGKTILYYIAVSAMVLVVIGLLEGWENQSDWLNTLSKYRVAVTAYITGIVASLIVGGHSQTMGVAILVVSTAIALILIAYSFFN
jgi:hypothetical protein